MNQYIVPVLPVFHQTGPKQMRVGQHAPVSWTDLDGSPHASP